MSTTMMMMANVNFVLLKINELDVGKLRQQQEQESSALNLLLSEETENIVLQLKRKSVWGPTNSVGVADYAAEEKGIEVTKRLCYLKLQQGGPENLPSSNNKSNSDAQEIIMSLHLPDPEAMSKSTQTDDMAFYVHEQLRNIQKDTERLIEEEHNLFEQSLAPEIDIEEITLRKTHSNERLGLTVCYSAGEEYGESEGVGGGSGNEVYAAAGTTEVYISDIHADSVAGRDGRLRQGDQILQINGKDITNREETETLIAENNNAVTLLVSRYLYGEDDFNDPSTNDDDDEVLVVEDDEEDDELEEDEEEEEFYDDNNMTYVNCMINKENCLNTVDDFDKVLMTQVVEHQKNHQSLIHSNNEVAATDIGILGAVAGGSQKAVGQTKASKGDKRSTLGTNTKKTVCPQGDTKTASATNALKVSTSAAENKTSDYYESEHIYETIPEDPESEPFYCSPYDSSVYVTAIASCSSSTGTTDALLQQQPMPNKQRVVQWLGINSTQQRHSMRNSATNCNRSLKYRQKCNTSSTGRSSMTSMTNGSNVDAIGSAMTLPAAGHADDHDNSSSAYNTGGSNNSVSPHSLLLNQKNRNDCAFNQVSTTNTNDDALTMQHLLLQHKIVAQQKILSPKDKNKITSPKSSNKLPLMDMQCQMNNSLGGNNMNLTKATMYTNAAEGSNLQRNMLMQQQQLLKQPMAIEKNPAQVQSPYFQAHQQMQEQMHCPPQFTAPNLSQYHFVSSQEVNNLSLSNKIPKSSPTIAENAAAAAGAATAITNVDGNDEAMVWKVKRRPDGTRYIVRRPAKSRNVKERSSVRLNMDRLRDDNTTTEDDNMSEVKTGRYWTREERKKHIEKAKERRQLQQQQQIQYQQHHQQQLQQQQLMQQQLQQKQNETANSGGNVVTNFMSCSRQKYRQHYQLQFNSAEVQKQKQQTTLNYLNQTTMTPMGCEDNNMIGGAGGLSAAVIHNNLMEPNEMHAASTTVTSASATHLSTTNVEHNNMSSTMISVTTV